ncbi:MAG: hypothetical protein J7605_20855 [Variovorax sp.]|nr:hypothetical protein [Variovorax sp.]
MSANLPPFAHDAADRDLRRHEKVVLVADLVDSVSLMLKDELGVIRHWGAFIDQVTLNTLPANEGRLVKSLGDGLLAEFNSAPQAAACALAMHRWFDESQRDKEGPSLRLRIGMHATHVYEGAHDIYGTGVNLAARIAALAQPGHTVMSSAARDGLTDGLDGEIEDLGEWYLKHVEQPLHVYGVRTAGQQPAFRTERADPAPFRPTIAVMPYTSRNVELDQFAIGDLIAEGVIGRMSRTQELNVISHLSTSALARTWRTLGQAETHLGADYVLSGSYAVTGNTVLVFSELANIRHQEVEWTGRAKGELEDLMQIDSQICDSIASGCHQALLEKGAQKALVRPLPTLESYGLLLGGIGLMHRSTKSEFLRSREVLDALVERHATHALPRIWLAKWYILCATRGLAGDARNQADLALQETRRALDVEPSHPLAWAMQGFVQLHLMKDVERALESCNQALDRSFNEPLAWLFKGMAHAFDGDGSLALPAGRKALDLSPLDPLKYYYHSLMASIAISAGEYETAIDFAQQSLRVNAAHLSTYRSLTIAQSLAGQEDAARATLALMLQRDPQFTVARFAQGYPARDRVPAYLEKLKDALRAAGARES